MEAAEGNGASGRRFTLVRTLGEGAFGSVFLADMESAGGFRRRVALKLLNKSWDSGSDAGRRLRDEARLLGHLQHQHIVRVEDLIRVEGQWALVMEYVAGADLERVFAACEANKRPPSPRAVAEIGIAIASALSAAWRAPGDDGHPLQVVHRDIKPSNVLLSPDGTVKVLDFGVARAHFAGREARTERIRYGSFGYMSPERLMGGDDTPGGDVYALGVMLWELFTLQTYGRAERGLDQHAAQLVRAREGLEPLIGAGAVTDTILACLAYEPVDRPLADEVEEALRAGAPALPGEGLAAFARAALPEAEALPDDRAQGRVLRESGGAVMTTAPRSSSATLVVDDPLPPPAPVPAPEPRKGAPVVWIAATLAALLVIGLPVAWWFTRTPEPAPVAAVAPPAAPVAPVVTPPPPVAPAPAAVPEPVPSTALAPEAAAPPVATPTPKPTAEAKTPPKAEAKATTSATSAKATEPAVKAPTATTPPATTTTAAPADTPRLRAAKFSVPGASRVEVTCGDRTAAGSDNALVRELLAGDCTVVADGHRATVRVTRPGPVDCTLSGDSLTCN